MHEMALMLHRERERELGLYQRNKELQKGVLIFQDALFLLNPCFAFVIPVQKGIRIFCPLYQKGTSS